VSLVTGKTTVAAAIGFGFASQCRAISSHTKVLACAFSNVGADNLAEAMLGLGLKVIRVGKPSAIAENLWNFTLEAAVHRDPEASKALADAARATAQLAKLNKRVKTSLGERAIREAATTAVKDSIRKCNVAATKALREVDIVVSTSSGAADHRLLAACGMVFDDSGASKGQASMERDPSRPIRELAPDGLPPLSLPFVLVDEACQSVEPATLIPIVSSNSCRSLVLLGDPCQLPPTVRSRQADPLSLSLMERLSVALPKPIVSTQVDNTMNDSSYLQSLAIRQSKSLLRFMDNQSAGDQAYRKRFAGSLLLSVQYRMHPSIAAFPSVVFYDGLLSTPVSLSMTSLRAFPSSLGHLMPGGDAMQCLRVINVGGRNNERRGNSGGDVSSVFSGVGIPSILEESTSYWNAAEALQVVSLLKVILRGDDSNVQTVGVISPYNGQVQLIKQMIASDIELRGLVSNGKRPLSIEVKSVDGYQGRERDVILFSAVRSNRQGRIGFLHDWRRMNVAMTRAKSAFLFVGDLATLSDADKHWAAFIKYASGLRIIINDMGSVEEKQTL
jgi:regulator of nonsense transcripts 1